MNLAFIWVRKTLHNPTSNADFCGKRQTLKFFPKDSMTAKYNALVCEWGEESTSKTRI